MRSIFSSSLYRRFISPSTHYYNLVQRIYAAGLRPKPNSLFYSPVLARGDDFLKGR